MKHVKLFLVILLVLLVIIVLAENIANLRTPVIFSVDFLFVKYETPNFPLGLVIVVAFLLGVLSMAICGITERFRLKRQIKTLLAEKNVNQDMGYAVDPGNTNK